MSDKMLTRVVDPAELPVTLDDVKAHARIEIEEDDLLVEGFMRAATEFAEYRTQRSLVTQEWELRYTKFPAPEDHIYLPRPPLQELISFKYVNASGDETDVDTDLYTVLMPVGPMAGKAVIVRNYSKSWPSYRTQPLGLVLRFRAGYGDQERSAEFVPDLIKQAISVHVAEMYENRESTVLTGAVIQQVPFNVEALLWPFIVDKLGI